ncbi:hypothetical protein RHMOL_Rhmol06G0026600 [Rhododendron molle]|uniref:Uncharacterized protein n=2 Tax=Rhododendron molle TaxID=49168 RepID=A0ACC0N8Y3_RHOML|nr:hypothetical protein RHMOL_Rhmol06G0026600 [Rhododendron molle]KAI8549466.1 hypothetical protein RHMOL_Rhmol06G0026600 [Rhododendron molle]
MAIYNAKIIRYMPSVTVSDKNRTTFSLPPLKSYVRNLQSFSTRTLFSPIMKLCFLSASSSRSIVLFSVSVLLIFSSSSTDAVVRLPENITIPAVLVFGDSIVDQGNNNGITATFAKSNFPPYGKDFMGGIPTGRFCNGKTPPDLLAEELGIKELVPAYLDPNLQAADLLTGVSFASGGAGFDPQTAQTAVCFSLDDQLKMFREYIGKIKGIVGEDRANFVLTNSLFFVVAGSDDLINTYFGPGITKLQYDINSYTDFMVQLACDFVKEVYALGAKRIAFLSTPPIGCLPSQRTLAGGATRVCAEKYNQAATLFNTKIKAALSALRDGLNDAQVRIVYIDIYNPLYALIQNHENYGFSIADKGCCGSGKIEVTILCNKLTRICSDDSMYLFWDSFHPTEKAYRVIVNMILQKYIKDFL